MAGKSNFFENAILRQIFNNVAIPGVSGADPSVNLWVALHTSDPDEGGNQSSFEATYTGYQRVGVARTPAGWTVSGSVVNPTNDITFGECTAGSSTISHFSVGTSDSGAGQILYFGTVSPVITVTAGILPRITTASTISED